MLRECGFRGPPFGLALFAAVVTGRPPTPRGRPSERRREAGCEPAAGTCPRHAVLRRRRLAAARAVVERARARQGGYVCLCNVHVLVLAQSDPGVREALEHAWAVLPDGWPVAWLQRRAGVPDAERIAGMELLTEVFELGSEAKLTHFLFGSSPEVLARMQKQLAESFPDAEIAGSFSPPFGQLDEVDFAPAVAAIRRRVAGHRLVRARRAEAGAVDAAARPADRARGRARCRRRVRLCRRHETARAALGPGHGMEWLHRLGSEPRRLIGRYASTGFMFVWYAGAWLARGRPERASASR